MVETINTSTSSKNGILNSVFLALLLAVIGIVIPQTIGLGKGGFDNEAVYRQFVFYASLGGVYLIFVLAADIYAKFKLKTNICFADLGGSPASSVFKNFSGFQMFLLSFCIFGLIALLTFSTQQASFTGFGFLGGGQEQQFQAIDSLLYSSALIPVSENAGAALVIAFAILTIYILLKKRNVNINNARYYVWFIVPIIVGLYGLANHMLRYSASESSLLVVFGFWFFGGLITVLTGSFIPFWVLHIFNNAIFDLKRNFSSDNIFIWFVFILVVAFAWYMYFYVIRRKR